MVEAGGTRAAGVAAGLRDGGWPAADPSAAGPRPADPSAAGPRGAERSAGGGPLQRSGDEVLFRRDPEGGWSALLCVDRCDIATLDRAVRVLVDTRVEGSQQAAPPGSSVRSGAPPGQPFGQGRGAGGGLAAWGPVGPVRVEIVCRSVEPRATEALCLLVLAGLPVQVQPVEVVPTSAPQVAAPPGEPDPVLACAPLLQVAAPTGERTPRSVRQLLVDGLIFAGDTLYLDQTGASRLAVVLPDGRLRLDDGKEIGEPDDVTGPLSLARPDAWSDWRVEGPLGPRLSDLWTRRERLAHSTSRVGNAG